jgi:hypothetical protein
MLYGQLTQFWQVFGIPDKRQPSMSHGVTPPSFNQAANIFGFDSPDIIDLTMDGSDGASLMACFC